MHVSKKCPGGVQVGHEAQIGGARHFFCLSDHAPIESRRVLSGRVHKLPVDSCDRRRRTTPEQRRSLLKGEGTGRANLEVGAIPVDDVTTRKCREQPGVRRGCCSYGFPSHIVSALTLYRDDTTIIYAIMRINPTQRKTVPLKDSAAARVRSFFDPSSSDIIPPRSCGS